MDLFLDELASRIPSFRSSNGCSMRRHIPVYCLLFLALPHLVGCAVMKAAQQPDKKNLSVFAPGVPRSHVIAEVGSPISNQQLSEGRSEDVFKFRQGYSKEVRVGRAVAHGVADLATGFLWELAGTPIEMIADGTEVEAVVVYDSENCIESIQILEGEQAFNQRPWSSRWNRVASSGSTRTPPTYQQNSSNPTLRQVGGTYPKSGVSELE